MRGEGDPMPARRVCFVSLYAYSLFNASTRYIFGGSEVRAWQFAKGLARRPGFEVSFVVFDHGQPSRELADGVTLYKQPAYRSYETTHPPITRWRSRWQALRGRMARAFGPPPLAIDDHLIESDQFRVYREIDADVYCGFGVTNVTAEIVAYCRAYDKKFVLLSGSDIDFSENYGPQVKERSVYGSIGHLCHFALTRADLVITQTEHQLDLLKRRFGRGGTVIANPIDLADGLVVPEVTRRTTALWVGKSDTTKQPEILLDLAKRFPQIHFRAVMNRSHADIHDRIEREAPANVEIIERIPFHECERLYADAFALINTSRFEGFPNTFLQAGKWGVPILSLSVDPDGFIERHGCGIVAGGDFGRFEAGFRTMATSPEKLTEYARNVRAYVVAHHDLEGRVDELQRLLTA